MGTMGFGLPAAIGAQLACPDRMVIDVDGDGSLRMNLGELETVTTYNLPVKMLLLNNLGDGMVRQWQKMYFGNRFSGIRQVSSPEGFSSRLPKPTDSFARFDRPRRKRSPRSSRRSWSTVDRHSSRS